LAIFHVLKLPPFENDNVTIPDIRVNHRIAVTASCVKRFPNESEITHVIVLNAKSKTVWHFKVAVHQLRRRGQK